MKKKNLLVMAAGVLAVGVYRAVNGKGVFNKIRFANQHEAVSKYVEAHHPGALYSPIEQTSNGWSCIITHGNIRYILYLTCSDDGIFIFDEKQL